MNQPWHNLTNDFLRGDRIGFYVRRDASGYDCALLTPYPTYETQSPLALDGVYEFKNEGPIIEIELLRQSDKMRSAIYLTPGPSNYISIPSGLYNFRYRFCSPVGVYRFSVGIRRLSKLNRVLIVAGKAIDVARRNPRALLSSAYRFVRRDRAKTFAIRHGAREPANLTAEPSPQTLSAGEAVSPYTVSIIIPTKDNLNLIKSCLGSLKMIEDQQTEIIVIDNGSVDIATLAFLETQRAQGYIKLQRIDCDFNFSHLCNAGARLATSEKLLFLNDDVECLDANWLSSMTRWFGDGRVGIVGARLIYPSGELQHAGIASNLVPGPGHPWRGVTKELWMSHPLLAQAIEVDAVTAACLLVDKELFFRLEGFDETAFPITLNDVDLCLRARSMGFKIIYEPAATLLHKEGQSRRPDDDPAEAMRRSAELAVFFERHKQAARHSIYYPESLRRDSDKALVI